MRLPAFVLMTGFVFGLIGGTVLPSDAATTYNGTTIVGIDESQRTITFRTREGHSWTLPVEDPELLKREQIVTGDQVSIELNLNDQITKIVKRSDHPQASQTQGEYNQ